MQYSSNEAAAAVFGIIAGLGIVSAIIGILISVLMIVAMWKIFKKAGESGWKSIIPVYAQYVEAKLFWKSVMFWVILGLAVVSAIIRNVAGQNPGIAVSLVSLACSIAIFVISIMLANNVSKSFGKGAGFTVGLVLLPVIFFPILAFGEARYIGPMGQADCCE